MMAVYVDDMAAKFGRMTMCHMLADTEFELHAMAQRIGVARRWHQKEGTPQSHYDICLSKRAMAVALGAIEITMRETGAIIRRKRNPPKCLRDTSDRPDAPCSASACQFPHCQKINDQTPKD